MDGASQVCPFYSPPDDLHPHGVCRGVFALRSADTCRQCRTDPAVADQIRRAALAARGPCPHQHDAGNTSDTPMVRCDLVDERLGWGLAFPAEACTACDRRTDGRLITAMVQGEAEHRLALGGDPKYDLVHQVTTARARAVLRGLGVAEYRVVEAWKRCRHRGLATGDEVACSTCMGKHVRLPTYPCGLKPEPVTMQTCRKCDQAEAPAPAVARPVADATTRGVVLVMRHRGHRSAQDEYLTHRIAEAGYERADMDMAEAPDGGLAAWVAEHYITPVGTVRWEEHAGLYGESDRWHQITRWCYDRGVVPLYVDFAYFGHYGGLAFDRYTPEGEPSTSVGFDRLPEAFDPAAVTGHLGQYMAMIRDRYDQARQLPPLVEGDYVAAYVQCHSPRSNVVPCTGSQQWVDTVYRLFGDRAVFKAAPVGDVVPPQCARWFPHDVNHPTINARLAVHSRYCLTNSSSITNEFLLAGLPVVVTGRSWYTGLGVFDEPVDWATLPVWPVPAIDSTARARYCHWWLGHQALNYEPSDVLRRVIQQGVRHMERQLQLGLRKPVGRRCLMCVSGSLGDVLMFVPAIKALAHHTGKPVDLFKTNVRYRDTMDLIVNQPWCGTVYERDQVPDLDRYERIIDCTPHEQPDVIARHSRYEPVRVGHAEHQVNRNMAMVRAPGSSGPTPSVRLALPDDVDLPDRWPDGAVILAPGIRGFAYKDWPESHWQRLAELLAAAGVPLVFTGLAGDQSEWMGGLGLNLCGKTTLAQLAHCMREAACTVATCTGSAHLAATQHATAITLHGPTSPDTHGAWNPNARYLSADRACSPCWAVTGTRHRCPLVTDGELSPCMAELAPERVAAEVLGMVNRPVGVHCRSDFARRWHWVQRHARTLQDPDELFAVYQQVAESRPVNVLEVGVYNGGWVAAMSKASGPGTRFLGVDRDRRREPTWQQVAEIISEYDGNSFDWLVGDSHSPEVLAAVRERMPVVDVLHVDACHEYADVKRDLVDYSPLVRPGGLLIAHDARHFRDVGVQRAWSEMLVEWRKRGGLTGEAAHLTADDELNWGVAWVRFDGPGHTERLSTWLG